MILIALAAVSTMTAEPDTVIRRTSGYQVTNPFWVDCTKVACPTLDKPEPSPIRIAHDRNPAAFCDGVWGLAVTIRQAGVDQADAISMAVPEPIVCPRPAWLRREPFTITVPVVPQFRSWDTVFPVGATITR